MKDNKTLINVIRGLAVFLMLWGHCIQVCYLGEFDFFEDKIFKFIYTFHMPLFMLISGYCFYFSINKRTLPELVIHRTQSLLQPIVMGTLLIFFTVTVVRDAYHGNFFTIFKSKQFEDINGLWFLWSVLSCSLAVAFIEKLAKNTFIKVAGIMLGVIFVALFPCPVMNLYMYPYFLIGYYYNKHNKYVNIDKFGILKFIVLALFIFMYLHFTRDCYIYTTGLTGRIGVVKHMYVNMFRWAIGLLGSASVITTVKYLYNLNFIKGSILILLSQLGEKSMQVYVISAIILSSYLGVIMKRVVTVMGHNIFIKNTFIYDVVFTLLLAIIYSILSLLIIRVLEKTKINRVIFGR